MVRIEKISMQGFKSFANKTVLVFLPGFNVISGPNGSGKSNVIDALCFVLGLRSAKSIRADRLNELIFKGGRKRSELNYASVSLYLNNEDKKIPGEGEEVRITRKVSKNGVSVYKLNGKTVNRRKIVDVLSNAGIHADGHNIIMQGDVTNLIEMSSIERREVIDEISGIGEFDDKKEKAEKELEKVDLKLKEVKIILNEKEGTMKKLEREQKLAKYYKELNRDLKVFSGSIIKKKIDDANEKLKKLKTEFSEKEKEFNEINKKYEELDKALDEKQREISKITSTVFKRDKNIREKQDLKLEIEKNKNKLDNNLREIQRIKDMISRLSEESIIVKKLKDKFDVYGTIGELFSTDSKYQNAMEVALGGRIHDIVVKSDDVAEKCINLLKKERMGRATFLPLNKIRYREVGKVSGQGIIGFAIDLIKYDNRYEPAIKYAFGETLVVENLEIARKYIGNYRMVTLDGDLILKSGAMTGGFRKESNVNRIMKYRKEIEKFEEENEEIKDNIAILEVKLDKIKEKEEEAIEEADISSLADETEKIRKERSEYYNKRLTLQTKVSDFNIRKVKIESTLENLNAEFEDYKDLDKFLDEDISTMENERRKIIEKLRRIGSVNQRAIEDYESMKLLYDDLKKKVDTIEQERNTILKMAEKIENKRRETFMKAFNGVNENFSKLFNEFNGGEAYLELEDPTNIRSGLIIKARPKGKKALNLDSMSGGEKTITALAFLFGVQMYKPAPFYILDEVDAALDKVNAKKISALIKNQSKYAQFIVITHNDVTLRDADQIYGVSMEDGVSKIIAVKLPDN